MTSGACPTCGSDDPQIHQRVHEGETMYEGERCPGGFHNEERDEALYRWREESGKRIATELRLAQALARVKELENEVRDCHSEYYVCKCDLCVQ